MTTAAIVGCGDVAVVHAEALAALNIPIVGIADTDPAGRERAAHLLPGTPVFASHEELIARTSPTVVHVTTPHHQHADVVCDLLERGIHVLQEKPLAHTLADGERIAAAAAASDAQCGVCFQNRYNAPIQALKQALDAGELGAVNGAYGSVIWARTPDYYDDRPWRGRRSASGGGLLINQAIHTLDAMAWLLGEPDQVAGTIATLRYRDRIDVEDTASAWFRHPGGVTSTFAGSLTNETYRLVEIEVYGSEGTGVIRDGLELNTGSGTPRRVPERRVRTSGRTYWGMSHQLLIQDFHQSIGSPERFWLGPEEALVSLRMVMALYADADRGRPHQGETA
ncbi:Gfo/Idh/MocA family oxidoreductase [Aestuariimicrobium sp. p3-SID1156]|uniref:Gfo/Idh/MocA family protein n=1 Tax=Aestuariimicrobium sp. p3-SID1156 TaxID=2916038 RepID=UPI00223B37C5|nr:Gfo/Idh/MocA family oxidoreductase [Aestuariimicrobium sp. p3-SID1156]MCT1458823.1 Gfo/Idh/MocA family oxidoreductase [Aestuariimicrobium sp. p3-SID1156]